MRVLLVDDEVSFADLLAERLTRRGLAVDKAYDCAGAARALAVEPFDVVVLDLNLPDGDGLSLLREIKNSSPLTEVVMLTGQADVSSAVEGMRLGAFNYLVKPASIDVLLREMRQASSRKSEREEQSRMIEAGKLAALGRLAEGVAHEINNPVNIVLTEAGWIGDILDDHPIPDTESMHETRTALDRIRTQSLRVREITGKLLMFGKGLDPRRREVDPAALLRETIEEAGPRAGTLGVTLDLDLSTPLPRLHASQAELRQAFLHLVRNSLDAMEEAASDPTAATGGTLTVTARPAPDGRAVEITFADTGPGIPPEVLPRVFEPFYSTRPVGRGTGLGLSICYGVIQSLGGSTSIESEPGRGTTVTLRIPAPEE